MCHETYPNDRTKRNQYQKTNVFFKMNAKCSNIHIFSDLTLTFLLMISRLIRTRPSVKSIPDKGTRVSPMTSSRENLSKLSTMK